MCKRQVTWINPESVPDNGPETADVVCASQLLTSQPRRRPCRARAGKVAAARGRTLPAPQTQGLSVCRSVWGGHRLPGLWSEHVKQPAKRSQDKEGKCGSHYSTGVLLPEKAPRDQGPFKREHTAHDPPSGFRQLYGFSRTHKRNAAVHILLKYSLFTCGQRMRENKQLWWLLKGHWRKCRITKFQKTQPKKPLRLLSH